jgi:hypothetical protein
MVGAEGCSGLGDGIFWVALVTVLAERHVGAGWYAAAATVRLGPRAVTGRWAGTLAERADRRHLLVGLDLARGTAMTGLAWVVREQGSLVLVLGIVLLTYTLAVPYRPAITSAIPLLADERDNGAANALLGTVRQALTFLGPLAGVGLLHLASSTWAILANAVTFVLSAALIAGIDALAGSAVAGDPMTRLMAVARRTGTEDSDLHVRLLVVAVFTMYLVRGAELVLHVLVAKDRLGLGASGVGLLGGAIGLGALAAMPVSTRVAGTDRPALVIVASLVLNAVPLALLAVSHSTVVAVVSLFVQGGALVAFEVVTLTVVQRLHPLRRLARAFGQVNAASNAGRLAGVLAVSAAVGAFGLRASLFATAAVVTAVAVPIGPGLQRLGTAASARRRELQPVVDVLARSALFESASTPALERVAAGLEVVRVPAGATVLVQGDVADALYLARSGTFDVEVDGTRINRMAADDWFGEIGLIHGRPRTATVRCTSDAELWRVVGDDFLAALADSSSPPTALLDSMSQRLARSAALDQG